MKRLIAVVAALALGVLMMGYSISPASADDTDPTATPSVEATPAPEPSVTPAPDPEPETQPVADPAPVAAPVVKKVTPAPVKQATQTKPSGHTNDKYPYEVSACWDFDNPPAQWPQTRAPCRDLPATACQPAGQQYDTYWIRDKGDEQKFAHQMHLSGPQDDASLEPHNYGTHVTKADESLCDTVVPVPAAPKEIDKCGAGNAMWDTTGGSPSNDYTYDTTSDGHLHALAVKGVHFADGSTDVDFGLPVETNTESCEIPIPAAPAVVDECGPGNAHFVTDGGSPSNDFTQDLDSTGNLTYIINAGSDKVFADGPGVSADHKSVRYSLPADTNEPCPIVIETNPSVLTHDECGTANDTVTLSKSEQYLGVDNGDGTATFTAIAPYVFHGEGASEDGTTFTANYPLNTDEACPTPKPSVTVKHSHDVKCDSTVDHITTTTTTKMPGIQPVVNVTHSTKTVKAKVCPTPVKHNTQKAGILPNTGGPSLPLALGGVLALMVGGLLMETSRRRKNAII